MTTLYCIKSGRTIGTIDNLEAIPCVVADDWIDTTSIKSHSLTEQSVYLINYCMTNIDKRLKTQQSIASGKLNNLLLTYDSQSLTHLYIKAYKGFQLNHQTTLNHYIFNEDDDSIEGFNLSLWEQELDNLLSDFDCTSLSIQEVNKIVARRKKESLIAFETKKRNISNLIDETLMTEAQEIKKDSLSKQKAFNLRIQSVTVEF